MLRRSPERRARRSERVAARDLIPETGGSCTPDARATLPRRTCPVSRPERPPQSAGPIRRSAAPPVDPSVSKTPRSQLPNGRFDFLRCAHALSLFIAFKLSTLNSQKTNIRLIELHILQSFPVSSLNRDEVGSTKTAVFGGVNRVRLSSQVLKRPIRLGLHEQAPSLFGGERSKLIIAPLDRRLGQDGNE